jgi:RNA polymerase sigma factor (TIGR02999 family)
MRVVGMDSTGVANPRDNDTAETATCRVDSDTEPTPKIFARLYAELHRVAERLLNVHGSDLSLGATTLLHETYLDLSQRDLRFADRPRFFAYAGRAMRTLIIDYVRRKRALKRGGEFELTSLSTDPDVEGALPPDFEELTRLNDALEALARKDAPLAQLVDLRFFCGLSLGEIASMRDISERSVQRDWKKARLFLFEVLRHG